MESYLSIARLFNLRFDTEILLWVFEIWEFTRSNTNASAFYLSDSEVLREQWFHPFFSSDIGRYVKLGAGTCIELEISQWGG